MLGTLRRFWRIIREVNLETIRDQAERPLHVAIVSEHAADRAAVEAMLLGGPGAEPRLLVAAPNELGEGAPPLGVAVLVSREATLAPPLAAVRDSLAKGGTRIVTVLTGRFEASAEAHDSSAGGEHARLWFPSLAPAALPLLAQALFDVVASDRRLALARQFPGLRPVLFEALIEETARANASYAFSTGLAEIVPLFDVPLNVGDVVILTKNQLIMAYRLALAAGKNGRPQDLLGEILGVVGGGLLFRQVARELVGLIPVLGVVPKVAVAYGGTWAIGQAVKAWASGGDEVTRETVRALYARGLEHGRALATSLRR